MLLFNLLNVYCFSIKQNNKTPYLKLVSQLHHNLIIYNDANPKGWQMYEFCVGVRLAQGGLHIKWA